MLVQAFFDWIETAGVSERAQAVDTLARAYLVGALGGDSPEEVEAALTCVLDDGAVPVRRALAMALANSPRAPRALVLSLARDQAEVAALLVARSPLLTEADLIDLAGSAERLSLAAIALRPDVTSRVAAAVVAREDRSALVALLRNRAAEIAPANLTEVARRHGEDARLREELLTRPELPPQARHHLMRAVAQTLQGFIGPGGFLAPARLSRLTSEALEVGTLTIAASAGEHLPDFIDHLREGAALTPALLLRAVLGGELRFVTHALAELVALPVERVEALLQGRSEAAVGALIRKAGLPDFLVPALISGLSAALRVQPEAGGALNLAVIRAAQSAIVSDGRDESLRLLALLRRYEAEAARSAARQLAQTLRRRETPLLALGAPQMASVASLEPAAPSAAPRADSVVQDEPAFEGEALRLSAFAGEEMLEPQASVAPVPDLATLIAEWRAEHAARDAERARLDEANENDSPAADDKKAA